MKTKTIYVADDGREFRDKRLCEMYDAERYYGMRFFNDGKEFNAYAKTFCEAIYGSDSIVITDAKLAKDFFEMAHDVLDCVSCPEKVSDGEVYAVMCDEDGVIHFGNLIEILDQLDSYIISVREAYHELREFCGIEDHLCEW